MKPQTAKLPFPRKNCIKYCLLPGKVYQALNHQTTTFSQGKCDNSQTTKQPPSPRQSVSESLLSTASQRQNHRKPPPKPPPNHRYPKTNCQTTAFCQGNCIKPTTTEQALSPGKSVSAPKPPNNCFQSGKLPNQQNYRLLPCQLPNHQTTAFS